jgi:hypothetical protein
MLKKSTDRTAMNWRTHLGVSLVPRVGLSALASPPTFHFGLTQMPPSLTRDILILLDLFFTLHFVPCPTRSTRSQAHSELSIETHLSFISMKQSACTFYSNFLARTDLTLYNDNALLLYALQIRYGIEDITEVASTSLVDGNDDKKTDLVYIDLELNEAIIAQGYFSQKEKKEAPSNKASDLNTAVTWLLNRKIEDLPDRLQSVAKELRQGIKSQDIKRITLWYCHNLPESKNVAQELKSAEQSLKSALKSSFHNYKIESLALEVGLQTLEDWYTGLTTPILVTDKIVLKELEGYLIEHNDWQSFGTYLQAKKLHTLFNKYGTKLFSANVRDYLGSRKSDSNINNGIKTTAEEAPQNFFVYNNGITALVNDFAYDKKKKELTINGFSIVNGAQTTGALGSISKSLSPDLFLPLRLIKCDNVDIIADIVKYNNSQNKINAPDFRSNDEIQRRLRKEFTELKNGIEYSARRGGSADVIRRSPNLLPSVTAGQVLAAFHGQPAVGYNEKSKIWESDKLYSTFFNDHTTAKHIFCAYSLLKALENKKLQLIKKESEKTALKKDLEFLSYLRTRGSLMLFVTAIASSLEEILDTPISHIFAVHFCKPKSLEQAIQSWEPIIDILSSFSNQLKTGLKDGIKKKDTIDSTLSQFTNLVRAIKGANSSAFTVFAKQICL